MDGLPKLRSDLEYSPYVDDEGSEGVVIKDPVRAKYFRVSKFEMAFLEAFDGTVNVEDAIDRLKQQGRYYGAEDAKQIFGKAAQAGLLLGTKQGTSEHLLDMSERMKSAGRLKRFSSIYYLYIPLINPDSFLNRTVWLFHLVYNRWMGFLILALIPGAIYLIADGFHRAQAEYLFFFNFRNLILLWIAIAFTKLIHEFAHAYVSKSYGLHVPVMGVGFILFFPVLYCDTTDAWTLADRRQRVAISAAGVLSEAILAVIGVYIWYFTKPGLVNSIAFYVMTFSLVSSILFNGNPLIKFDGYFVLVDLIRKPNLAQRSQGFVKYLWMNRVLGIEKWPNTAKTPKEAMLFALYGISAFIYRFFIVTGIVAGVYYRFDKSLGILLAGFAVILMIIFPLIKGTQTLIAHRRSISPRFVGTAVFVSLVIIAVSLTFVPWSGKSVFPCYMESALEQKLTVPMLSAVKKVHVREGESASSGQVLFDLNPEDLLLNLIILRLDREILKSEAHLYLLDEVERAKAAGKEIELRQKEEEITKVLSELRTARTGVIAPFGGILTRLDANMQPGYEPGKGTIVGEFKSMTRGVVRALVPERDVERVRKGQEVTLWFPVVTGVEFRGTVDQIRPYSAQDFSGTPFASSVGGEIATEMAVEDQDKTTAQKREVALEPQYIIESYCDNSKLGIPLGMTGRCAVVSPPRSLLSRMYDAAIQTFNRESFF